MIVEFASRRSRLIFPLLLFLSVALVMGAAEPPSQPITLSPAEGVKAAKTLVEDILSQRPTQDTASTGVLKKGRRSEIPIQFQVIAGTTNWSSIYEVIGETNGITRLTVIRTDGKPNEYQVVEKGKTRSLSGNEAMIPFAGSDFWVADLGLEFIFWPEQRVLRKEIRRGQSCSVLESINPQPAPGAYARVVSWVDIDSGGIINADAYDSKGKPLKEFIAKSVKKVRGQWELKEIEMDNRQTGSRTWLEFDLGK
jgi:Outer membrane lipoprotein-sorting protein